MNARKSVLLISPFYSPNVGGVETHLDDLVSELGRRGHVVHVHTYSPVTTPNVTWKARERQGENIHIRRYRWFGHDLFHRLEKYPFLDFLYIAPYLGFRVFLFMLIKRREIDVIHAHGLNAALIGVVLKKLFARRLIVSTHAVYEFNGKSRATRLARAILDRADRVLCLSDASRRELAAIGVNERILGRHYYWVDLDVFRPMPQRDLSMQAAKYAGGFNVLFVGRMIAKKGVVELLEVAKRLGEVSFLFGGGGPLEDVVRKAATERENVHYLGMVRNSDLPGYYNVASVLCIPSQYEEGYGRVVMEAVSCGTPVVGSRRGGIPEALDETVSILVEPTVDNLTEVIVRLHRDKALYGRLKANCRAYAVERFSRANVERITDQY